MDKKFDLTQRFQSFIRIFSVVSVLFFLFMLGSCSAVNGGETSSGGETTKTETPPSIDPDDPEGGNSGNEEENPGTGEGNGNGDPDDPPVVSISVKSGVMLQGFNWSSADRTDPSTHDKWYGIMSNNADSIKNSFAYVWFPPPSPSENSSPEGYLPTEWNNLTNAYGTQAQLKKAIQDIKPAKAIADVVVNHRNGYMSWGRFANPSLCGQGHDNCHTASCSDFSAIASNDEGFTSSSSEMYNAALRGANDSGESYAACRDLDHTNTQVQNGITTWMNNILKDAGFVGWRYDFVKGFDGEYVGQYNAATSAEFAVGEYWPTAGFSVGNPTAWGNEIKSWVAATASTEGSVTRQRSRAFDFALKGIMNSVFGNNSSDVGNNNYGLLANAASLMQSQPSDAVTFIDNHDTGSTQLHWYLDPADIGTAYAFILTHPGYPCVAWQHYFTAQQSGVSSSQTKNYAQYIGGTTVSGTSKTYREHINHLIHLRNTVGIEYDDTVDTAGTTSSVYVGKITGNNGELVVAIGGSYTPTGDGYSGNSPVYSGTNFAIWQKGASGSGGESGGETQTVTLTVTADSWTWSNSVKIFAWVWGGAYGDGQWISASGSGTTVTFTANNDLTNFLLVRCHPNTVTPDWGVTTEGAGKIYNKTADQSYSGTTSYTVTWTNP